MTPRPQQNICPNWNPPDARHLCRPHRHPRHLPDGYEEFMQYGMISYIVPLSVIPDTYNGQPLMYIALASQKHYMSLYLTTVYADQSLSDWFKQRYLPPAKSSTWANHAFVSASSKTCPSTWSPKSPPSHLSPNSSKRPSPTDQPRATNSIFPGQFCINLGQKT